METSINTAEVSQSPSTPDARETVMKPVEATKEQPVSITRIPDGNRASTADTSAATEDEPKLTYRQARRPTSRSGAINYNGQLIANARHSGFSSTTSALFASSVRTVDRLTAELGVMVKNHDTYARPLDKDMRLLKRDFSVLRQLCRLNDLDFDTVLASSAVTRSQISPSTTRGNRASAYLRVANQLVSVESGSSTDMRKIAAQMVKQARKIRNGFAAETKFRNQAAAKRVELDAAIKTMNVARTALLAELRIIDKVKKTSLYQSIVNPTGRKRELVTAGSKTNGGDNG